MPAPKCVKIIERLEGNSLTLFDVVLIHFKLKLLSHKVKHFMWGVVSRRSRWPARTYPQWETTAAGRWTASTSAGDETYLCPPTKPYTAFAMNATAATRRSPTVPSRHSLSQCQFWLIYSFFSIKLHSLIKLFYTLLKFSCKFFFFYY